MSKTITVSDQDYETLMELSKQLQTQENDYQAFPYFWQPASTRLELDYNQEGQIIKHVDDNGEEVDPIEHVKEDEELLSEFKTYVKDTLDIEFEDATNEDYIKFIESELKVVHYKEVQETDDNFSLFKEDVKNYVNNNQHRLGKNPHTFGGTIQRMPKMNALVEALIRLNPQSDEKCNKELHRFKNK